ncbi:hypothetical protein BT69DRAFT_591967 [Atractiella rhizophila]|nr:hypothetical protein BT69DRAFT_591967 [Atractiella rhizophila]
MAHEYTVIPSHPGPHSQPRLSPNPYVRYSQQAQAQVPEYSALLPPNQPHEMQELALIPQQEVPSISPHFHQSQDLSATSSMSDMAMGGIIAKQSESGSLGQAPFTSSFARPIPQRLAQTFHYQQERQAATTPSPPFHQPSQPEFSGLALHHSNSMSSIATVGSQDFQPTAASSAKQQYSPPSVPPPGLPRMHSQPSLPTIHRHPSLPTLSRHPSQPIISTASFPCPSPTATAHSTSTRQPTPNQPTQYADVQFLYPSPSSATSRLGGVPPSIPIPAGMVGNRYRSDSSATASTKEQLFRPCGFEYESE